MSPDPHCRIGRVRAKPLPDNVFVLYGGTLAVSAPGDRIDNRRPADVLLAAVDHDLRAVVVIGESKDGSLYCAGSTSDAAAVGHYLDRAKRRLLTLRDMSDPDWKACFT